MDTTLIPVAEVAFRIGASRSFVKTSVAAGRFPPPLVLGVRKRVWLLREVEDWLQDRAADRDKLFKPVGKRK